MKDMNYVYMSTSMEALCRHVNKNKSHGVGGDINVHVPCLHRWMLRCCYVTGHGWGGGGY